MKFVSLFVILSVALAVWLIISRRAKPRALKPHSDDIAAAQRKFLLVVLRRVPADLRAETLEAAARTAWSAEFGPNGDGSNYVERGLPGIMYVLQAHGNALTIFGSEKGSRTWDPPLMFVSESAAALWGEYTHDLSVGVAYNYDTDQARLGGFVARLTAALCDEHSIALLHPATRRFWTLDRRTVDQLVLSPDPFFDETA